MRKAICPACNGRYWIQNKDDTKACPNCGGTGKTEGAPCSECGKALPVASYKFGRKTCGPDCARDREARLAREDREKRELKRQARQASSGPRDPLDAPLNPPRKCTTCGREITNYRCQECWAKRGRKADDCIGVGQGFGAFSGGHINDCSGAW